jgi:arginase
VEQATAALEYLAPRVDHIQLRLDVDVIDSAMFPAGNFPSCGGIQFEETMESLHCFIKSLKARSMSMAEINPSYEPDGSMVSRLVNGLVSAFDARLQSLKPKKSGHDLPGSLFLPSCSSSQKR